MPWQNDILAGSSGQADYEGYYETWYEGDLWGWGLNTYTQGAVGNNTANSNVSSPIQIGTDDDWVISGKQKSKVYTQTQIKVWKTDGVMWHWGRSQNNVHLSNSNAEISSPVAIGTAKLPAGASADGWISKDTSTSPDTRLGMITTSGQSCLAIRADGQLWVWGSNHYGTLGLGHKTAVTSATQVGSDSWVRVTMGFAHIHAIKDDGTLWAWGRNSGGQLGVGDTIEYISPVQVGSDKDWYEVVTTDYTTIGLKTDGTLWGWGQGAAGCHGLGETISRSSPVQIGSDTDWEAEGMTNGKDYIGATKNGELWMWGTNNIGQCGFGADKTNKSVPTQLGTLTNWKYVSTSGTNGAVKTDGTLWTWGISGTNVQGGVLGDGTTTGRSSPAQVGSATDWLQIQNLGSVMHALRTP